MIRHLLPWILFMFLTSGCQKTQDYFEFDLTVVDQNGNEVEGATVDGFIQPASSGGVGSYELRESGVTDNNGKVNIKIDKETAYGFQFSISAPNHFAASHEILADQVPVTSPYRGELDVYSQSWLRLNIENASGAIAIFWNFDVEAPECDTCCTQVSTPHVIQGLDVDTTMICTLFGDQNFTLEGSYTDAQIMVHPFNHSLLAPTGDTLVYDLIY